MNTRAPVRSAAAVLATIGLTTACPQDGDTKATADSGSAPTSAHTGTPPSNTDSTPPPPPSGQETVRVLGLASGAPLAGIEILVSSPDGGVVLLTSTDPAGEVIVDVPTGGMVSALIPGTTTFFSTAFDVPEGATVVFFDGSVDSPTTAGEVFTIEASATKSPPEVTQWHFLTRCDGAVTDPGPHTFSNAACTSFDTEQVLIVGTNGTDLVAWNGLFDIPLTGDLDIELPLTETAVDEVEVTFTGIPSGALSAFALLSPRHVGWRPYTATAFSTAPVGSALLRSQVPALDYDSYTVFASLVQPGNRSAARLVATTEAPGPITFDASQVATISILPLDQTDPARPLLNFTSVPSTFGDEGELFLNYTNAEHAFYVWRARFDPSARTSLHFPDVPTEWASHAPIAASFGLESLQVREYDLFADYAAALGGGALPNDYVYDQAAAFGTTP